MRFETGVSSIAFLALLGCGGGDGGRGDGDDGIGATEGDETSSGTTSGSSPLDDSESGADPSGGACESDEDCGAGAVCVDEGCCPTDDACGSQCCGDGQVCFALACVTLGDPCASHADCGPDQICQPNLGDAGDPPNPPPGKVCLGTVDPGHCIDLPLACDHPDADPDNCTLAECEYVTEPGPLDAVIQWQWGQDGADEYPEYADVWATPTVGRIYDTNCDGQIDALDPPAVVFVAGHLYERRQCSAGIYDDRPCQQGVLRALDGATGAELWSLRRPHDGAPGFAGMSVALGDITGDGRMEVVAAGGDGRIAIIDGDGNPLAISEEPIAGWNVANFGWGGGLAIADVDGDGYPEIGYGDQIFTTHDAQGGLVLTRYVGGQGGRMINRATSFFVDLDGDGRLELLAGRIAYAFDGQELTALWNREGLPANAFDAIADFDGDGLPEVVLVGNGQLWILDGATGATELGPVNIPGSGSGGPPTVADFRGEGKREIGVAMQDNYSLFSPNYDEGTIEVMWSELNHDHSSSVTGSTVFDFEGDGIAEVVYADECYLWVYDGPTGQPKFIGMTTSFTGTEASVVADVDGDGSAEIVLVSNGVDTTIWNCSSRDGSDDYPMWIPPGGVDGDRSEAYRGITVFRDSANSWVGTRTLWNQHAYDVTNVCSGQDSACDPPRHYGAIPENPLANWLVDWLNNFRQNVQESGLHDAPDATVSIAIDCTIPVVLKVVVRNRGRAILPEGVRVGLFRRDGANEVLLGEVVTPDPIFPGGAIELAFTVPEGEGVPADTYFAEIIVDPDSPTFRECDEDNNTSEDVACIVPG
jgi:hypothetical protein